MKTKVLAVLTALLLLTGLFALADREIRPHLYDRSGTFSASEKAHLEKLFEKIRQDLQVDVVVVTTNNSQGMTAKNFANSFYRAVRPDFSGTDGIVFAFCFDLREYWEDTIWNRGDLLFARGESELNRVLKPYLKPKDYYGAMVAYAAYLRDVLTPGSSRYVAPEDLNTVFRNSDTADQVFPTRIPQETVLMGLGVFSLIAALIVVFAMKAQMKIAKYKHGATDYVRRGSLNLSNSQDIFLYQTVTRTKIVESSSRGSSGGGFHSSGSSSGGRGGSL